MRSDGYWVVRVHGEYMVVELRGGEVWYHGNEVADSLTEFESKGRFIRRIAVEPNERDFTPPPEESP